MSASAGRKQLNLSENLGNSSKTNGQLKQGKLSTTDLGTFVNKYHQICLLQISIQ